MSQGAVVTRGQFSWAGTSTVGSYCVSATASHYGWAMKKIKRHTNPQRVS
ncbi:MAG: ClbS/DfsB family four-helix bundle protein [Clostridiales bacterium]|nr:ClbS/DfsB family four-helix bundle protein [Clostridiales bacterium]